MSRLYTKKSLIVSAALVVAIVCTGIVAVSAHTGPPARQNTASSPQQGVPAIPPPRGQNGLLSLLDVTRYLNSRGFVGGPTLNGGQPGIQNPHLTTVGKLKSQKHLSVPGVPDDKKVYYTQLKGPFRLLPNIPRSVFNLLAPSKNNVPSLRPLLPGIGQTLGLGDSNNNGLLPPLFGANRPPQAISTPQATPDSPAKGSRPAANTTRRKTPGQNSLTSSVPPSLGKLPTAPPSRLGTVLQNVYEVFDAQTGNLLAWG